MATTITILQLSMALTPPSKHGYSKARRIMGEVILGCKRRDVRSFVRRRKLKETPQETTFCHFP